MPDDDVAAGFGAGGASTGERCTVTPGPAGVVTSDQLTPFHQRAWPGAPSGMARPAVTSLDRHVP